MQLAIGQDLSSSCIDTMLSIATQVIIYSIYFTFIHSYSYSCPVISYHVLSCHILSYPVLSCPVLSYPVISCPVLSCPVPLTNILIISTYNQSVSRRESLPYTASSAAIAFTSPVSVSASLSFESFLNSWEVGIQAAHDYYSSKSNNRCASPYASQSLERRGSQQRTEESSFTETDTATVSDIDIQMVSNDASLSPLPPQLFRDYHVIAAIHSYSHSLQYICSLFCLIITSTSLSHTSLVTVQIHTCVMHSLVILSHLISSYLILSHLISSYLILSHLILSYLISSYLILSHLISSSLICIISSYVILCQFFWIRLIKCHSICIHFLIFRFGPLLSPVLIHSISFYFILF